MEILIVILVDSYYFEVDLGCNLVSKMACFLFSGTINAGFNFLATLQSFYWPLIGEFLRREVNLVRHPRIKGFCINNSPLLTSYSVFSMLRPVSSPTHASTIEGWVSSGDTSFTGWMPMTGFGSECVSRCTSVYTTWRLDTCRHSANPCPAFLVVVTYARLVVVNWTFHVSIWLRTGDGRLPMPVPHLGTFYLTVSRTLILLCKPSNATLRLSFFLHTSTFSAFQVSYKNALYKSTVIINQCLCSCIHCCIMNAVLCLYVVVVWLSNQHAVHRDESSLWCCVCNWRARVWIQWRRVCAGRLCSSISKLCPVRLDLCCVAHPQT